MCLNRTHCGCIIVDIGQQFNTDFSIGNLTSVNGTTVILADILASSSCGSSPAGVWATGTTSDIPYIVYNIIKMY